ncbi:uncharacterized protein LOC126771867 [Nymphalis io]|uniref:uncharacterized protein LOC126771867 n=1 Tax=Inachis io TaxID=171585 RepID=UPI00216A0615|nr:uncharacterized protein LOC126771867 [Nymphalis io]
MSPYCSFLLVLCCLILPLWAKRGGSTAGRSIGSHYPASNGLSGNSYVHTYPHAPQSYPGGTHTHSYPHTPGLSGNNRATHGTRHTAQVNHYHYYPPQQISYGSAQHPVFHGQPPVYVYEYRNSGSRFDNLLTGLALYNLGRMSSNQHDHYHNREYTSNPGEICKLSIHKTNGEYEETRIDCKLISSFIWDAEREQKTITNVTKTISVIQNVTNGNSTVSIQNTTVVDALQVKGPSISVTPGMSCFMIRISRDTSKLKRKVECGLLQEYATKSLRYNSGSGISPMILVLILTFISLQILKPH